MFVAQPKRTMHLMLLPLVLSVACSESSPIAAVEHEVLFAASNPNGRGNSPSKQPVTSVVVQPVGVTLVQGGTQQLTATAYDSGGKILKNRTIGWASANVAVALVSSAGLVTAIAPGGVTVTATVEGISATSPVSVAAPASTGEILIYPGDDMAAVVAGEAAGAAFLIKSGLHRPAMVTPKDGMTFRGEPGAVLSGARLLSGFTSAGSGWTLNIGTVKAETSGRCLPEFPRCVYREQLFVDDVMLKHVESQSDVTTGSWHLDYATGTVTVGTDPSGRRVDLATTRHAFSGTASNVEIRGLIIEKYANPAQTGAIHGRDGSRWTVENNEVRLNHGIGVRVSPYGVIRGNHLHHNGQLGIGGGGSAGGDGILVEQNEIAYNNTAGFNHSWEAGGGKFTRTTGMIVRNNYVHHNHGTGLWTDIENRQTLYEGNVIDDNLKMGIHHEISYSVEIRNNTIRRNGFGKPQWLWGGGIVINMSSDATIHNNQVLDNADGITGIYHTRGTGTYGLYVLKNMYVYSNTVRLGSTGHTGIVQDVGDNSPFTSLNNRFEGNTYYMGPKTWYFNWMNASITEAQWKAYGQDVTGQFIR